MDESKRKEEISRSYLNAICAAKGIAMEHQHHDEDGIDVILKKIIERKDGLKYNALISVQLKSSSLRYIEHDRYYSYRLNVKNYNDLRMQATIKSYLFLLVLPEIENDWVTHNIDQLIIKRCMYWLDLAGMPDTENSSTVTVDISKANIVSPEMLNEILHAIAENG